jgi:hypothetical protein
MLFCASSGRESNLLFGCPCDNLANPYSFETHFAANRFDNNGEAPAMCSRWASLLVLMHITSFSGAATAQTLDEQPCSASNASNPDLMISGAARR